MPFKRMDIHLDSKDSSVNIHFESKGRQLTAIIDSKSGIQSIRPRTKDDKLAKKPPERIRVVDVRGNTVTGLQASDGPDLCYTDGPVTICW
jgi:hypothetical protein